VAAALAIMNAERAPTKKEADEIMRLYRQQRRL
jgi:hypothetical protein